MNYRGASLKAGGANKSQLPNYPTTPLKEKKFLYHGCNFVFIELTRDGA